VSSLNTNGVTYRSDFDVDLVQVTGDDQLICQAARVSTLGADSLETEESAGLINFLMKNRHGSPFEHAALTFRITAPIAVWRDFMRHRIGFSYNEESGRYKVLDPVFYMPRTDRPLQQVGKAGAYSFEEGTEFQRDVVMEEISFACATAWWAYRNMLDEGIAKEVARFVLPVATYSTAYVTCNPRSLMAFLSLRTKHPGALFPSFPQWEIDQVANQMEGIFKEHFPLTHKAFNQNGRVSP
jgi:thymidylate synthase (FAD)